MPRGGSTPFSVRELIVKLCHDDKLSIRAIADNVKRLKSVVQVPLVFQRGDLAKPRKEMIMYWLDYQILIGLKQQQRFPMKLVILMQSMCLGR